MTSEFDYLINKIEAADWEREPFKHIEIAEFINPNDFHEIISCEELDLRDFVADEDLIDALFSKGYKMVPFPGAITDHREYIRNRQESKKTASHTATESAGLVFRLVKPKSEKLVRLKKFLESDDFNNALANKFDLDFSECIVDVGIQKYLDEYEISPHPDLRKKAATFMVNINCGYGSEQKNHHTHYLKFKPERAYVLEYWKGNPLVERCWVPWEWCESVKQQTENNSFIAFSPSFDTMHAVRASYNHLTGQRSQLYGNLWHKADDTSPFIPSVSRLDWEEFDFGSTPPIRHDSFPKRVLAKLTKMLGRDNNFIDRTRRGNY